MRVAANTGTDTWLEIPRSYKKAEKDYHNPLTPVQRTENIADRSAVYFHTFGIISVITKLIDQNPLGYPGSVVETASGEIRAAVALCSDGAAARVPVPKTLPELHFPPELDFDKTQKLDWVWDDSISGEFVDP